VSRDSKLDPQSKARDFRRLRKRRRRRHENDRDRPTHEDITSVIFASQQPDAESRFVVLDVLPDMSDEWLDKIVYVRNTSAAVDRAYMGIQNIDDSLVWIELTLAAAAPANPGDEEPPPPDPSGITFIRHYGEGMFALTGNFFKALGIAVDVAGATKWIWAADTGGGELLRINPITGALALSVVAPQPRGIAISGSVSAVYWVESREGTSGNSRIRKRELTGTLSTPFTGGTERLAGLAMDPDNASVILADQGTTDRLRRVRLTDGVVLANYTHANLVAPEGVYVAPDGTIYACSSLHVVLKFSSAGALLNTLGTVSTPSSADGQFNLPMGVYVDSLDRVYVADRENARIQIFDHATGAFIDKFGIYGIGDGQMLEPVGVAGVGTNPTTIYVMDGGEGIINSPRISAWEIADSVI
jgi:hypothetical protein